jgi:hypothetical protein
MFSAKNESVPEEPASCNGWRPESRIGNEIPAKPTASVRIASRCVLYDGPRILERLLVIILRRRPLFQECFVSWKFEQTALGALTIVVIGLTPSCCCTRRWPVDAPVLQVYARDAHADAHGPAD